MTTIYVPITDSLPPRFIEDSIQIGKYYRCNVTKNGETMTIDGERAKIVADIIKDRYQNPLRPEVRKTNEEGQTTYLRPLPGPNRMYPETDGVVIKISPDYIAYLKKNLPELLDVKKERFIKEYKLSEELAEILTDMVCRSNLFEKWQKENPNISSTLIFRAVMTTEKVHPEIRSVLPNEYRNVFLPDLKSIVKQFDHEDFIRLRPFFEQVNSDDLQQVIQTIYDNNKELKFGNLMEKIMKETKYKYRGKDVAEILKKLVDV